MLGDLGVGGQRADQTDVRTLRGLDRAHAPVMGGVRREDLDRGALARQPAGAERREAAAVGQAGQRVGLVHELRQLRGAEELLQRRHDRADVDDRLRRDRVGGGRGARRSSCASDGGSGRSFLAWAAGARGASPAEPSRRARGATRAMRGRDQEVRPSSLDGRVLHARLRAVAWKQLADAPDDPDANKWEKTAPIDVAVDVQLPSGAGDVAAAGRSEIAAALAAVGANGLAGEVHAEIEAGRDGPQLALTVVNVSPMEVPGLDTNLYEVQLEADIGPTDSFLLDGLPDSFRYDRRVQAYGVNGGVAVHGDGVFTTSDYASFDKRRPDYWDERTAGPMPDLSFRALAADPLGPTRALAAALHIVDRRDVVG